MSTNVDIVTMSSNDDIVLVHSPSDLGLLIRDQRKRLGLDQRTLAERVGASRQWLVAVEKGKATAEIGLVLRTLRALAIDLDARPGKPVRGELDLDRIIERAKGKAR